MIIHKVQQGTADWYRKRLGKPTSSQFHKIITPGGKRATGKQVNEYLYRLICEKLLNEATEDQIGHIEWVQRGKENEPLAAAAFEFREECQLEEGGFVTDDNELIGCSPDRLITGRNEALELKCPQPWTHVGYLLDGPGEHYKPQVQGQLLIGEWDACYFFSWHKQCPPYGVRTQPDLAYQRVMRDCLDRFLDTLDAGVEKAKSLGAFVPATYFQAPLDAAYPEVQAGVVVPDDRELDEWLNRP